MTRRPYFASLVKYFIFLQRNELSLVLLKLQLLTETIQ